MKPFAYILSAIIISAFIVGCNPAPQSNSTAEAGKGSAMTPDGKKSENVKSATPQN